MNIKKVFTKQMASLILIGMFFSASNAMAWHPDAVKRLAHKVENKARHVHRQAEIESHHGDRAERRAIRILHRLEKKARHFHQQVENYWQSPSHTRRDFRRLKRVFYRAENALYRAHFTHHVMNDFSKLADAMYNLDYEYGWDDGHGDWDDGHGGGHHNNGHNFSFDFDL